MFEIHFWNWELECVCQINTTDKHFIEISHQIDGMYLENKCVK